MASLTGTRRRFLATALAGTALAAVGCRAVVPVSATPGPKPRLSVWGIHHPVAAVAEGIARNVDRAAGDAGVVASFVDIQADSIVGRVDGAAAAGQLPDVALVSDVDVGQIALRGFLLNVRGIFTRVSAVDGEAFPPLVDLVQAGPALDLPSYAKAPLWAVPFASLGSGFLVRSDRLAVKSAQPPESFDQLSSVAAALSDSSGQSYAFGMGLGTTATVENVARVAFASYGCAPLDASGLQTALPQNEGAAALTALAHLYAPSSTSQDTIKWTDTASAEAFIAGNTSIAFDPGGLYARILTEQPNLARVVTVLAPIGGSKQRLAYARSSHLAVFSLDGSKRRSDERVTLAADFVERFLQPTRFSDLVRAGRGAFVPAYAYLTKSNFWNGDPNYVQLGMNARGDPANKIGYAEIGYPGPPTPAAEAVDSQGVLAGALRAVIGGAAPADALKSARDAIDGILNTLVEQQLRASQTPTPSPGQINLAGHSIDLRTIVFPH